MACGVSEGTTPSSHAAQEWVDRLFAEEPSPLATNAGGCTAGADDDYHSDYHAAQPVAEDADRPPPGELPIDLDDQPAAAPDPADDYSAVPAQPVDANAGARRVGWWLCAGAVLVAVLIVLVIAVFGGGPDPAPVAAHRASAAPPAISAAPTTGAIPMPPRDQAVPFTAATASCSAGSTSPQALTDTSTDSAWVCARGPQESFLDGQVLHVNFTCAGSRPESSCSYMLNSVSVIPGWLAKTPGGIDQWLAHRVVTRLQFNFFNGNQLAADPFFLDTNSVHGPVPATLPTPVLACRVDVLILHTDRPPAAPLPTASPESPGADQTLPGFADPGQGGTAATTTDPPGPTGLPTDPTAITDPVDATFAMSQLQFFGHSPN